MYSWRPYVSAADRKASAQKRIAKLEKQGKTILPVTIEGRKIARTFWGIRWCDHLESFSDYENRLPRGQTYVRNGSVCHLEIKPGLIEALVSGSEMYNVSIEISKLPESTWKSIKQKCSGQIGSILELLQGSLSSQVMDIVSNQKNGLFPQPREIRLSCSCPDWANMCKHVAAVMYGVGHRLDTQPDLLFLLRGVDPAELIDHPISLPDSTSSDPTLANSDLSNIFGIELDSSTNPGPTASAASTSRTKKAATTKKTAASPQIAAAVPSISTAPSATIEANSATIAAKATTFKKKTAAVTTQTAPPATISPTVVATSPSPELTKKRGRPKGSTSKEPETTVQAVSKEPETTVQAISKEPETTVQAISKEPETTVPTTKKKRGRPRKNPEIAVPDSSIMEPPLPSLADIVHRKKRGRPVGSTKKKDDPSQGSTPKKKVAHPQDPTTKRKVGRPIGSTKKKKAGRPKGSTTKKRKVGRPKGSTNKRKIIRPQKSATKK